MLSDKEFFEMDEKAKKREKEQPPLGDYIEQFCLDYMSEPPEDFWDKLIDERMSELTKEDLEKAVDVFRLLIKWRDEKSQNEK